MSQDKQKPKAVYTIIERENLARGIWVRIGSAFENRDGSMTVRLDALPLGGALHIREVEAPPPRVHREPDLGAQLEEALQ